MVSITRYDPVGDLLDDFLKGFLVRPAGFSSAPARGIKIDVAEQNGEYKVLAELPGVKKDDIKVAVDGDQVSISAETRVEGEDGERVLHSERSFGRVSRAFRLGQELDEARVTAKYADGVLELILPKKATAAARQITIQ